MAERFCESLVQFEVQNLGSHLFLSCVILSQKLTSLIFSFPVNFLPKIRVVTIVIIILFSPCFPIRINTSVALKALCNCKVLCDC